MVNNDVLSNQKSSSDLKKEQLIENNEANISVKLSGVFFMDLLTLPQCKLIGECDGCGRCEH